MRESELASSVALFRTKGRHGPEVRIRPYLNLERQPQNPMSVQRIGCHTDPGEEITPPHRSTTKVVHEAGHGQPRPGGTPLHEREAFVRDRADNANAGQSSKSRKPHGYGCELSHRACKSTENTSMLVGMAMCNICDGHKEARQGTA